MSQVDGLLSAILDRPEEQAGWLVLADWLEEQGDPLNTVRGEILRLQAERIANLADSARTKALDEQAAAIFAGNEELAGPLKPLLGRSFPPLAVPSALVLFLTADLTSVVEEPLSAGTIWEGALRQAPDSFPTTLWLRERAGNRFSGDMKEDFSSMSGPGASGRFYFRGVTFGKSHVAFVTYRLTGGAAGPGLYQFTLNRRRLKGTWMVGLDWTGTLWLKQKRDERA